MAKQGKERRRHERKPVHIRIKYKFLNQFLEDYIKNISLGGIFVATSEPLPVRTRLKVQFSLPAMKSAIETEGIVVHSFRKSGKHDPHASGMGIKFSDLSAKCKEVIDAYLTGGKAS